MKKLIAIFGLALLVGACALNDENKKIPGTHEPPYHLHADIWNIDSINFEPLDALVTIDSVGITRIESWDGQRKTRDEIFKTLKVKWDGTGSSGTFKMLGKNYKIQVLDDVDDVYKYLDISRKPDSVKK